MKRISTNSGMCIVLIVTIVVFLIALLSSLLIKGEIKQGNIFGSKVTNVIDGDTFDLESGERVRLICIDTPEISTEGGKQAKAYLESLILNKTVYLEKDVNDKDRFGRLLRYVYINNMFVNKLMVSSGNAEPFPYGEDIHKCPEIRG